MVSSGGLAVWVMMKVVSFATVKGVGQWPLFKLTVSIEKLTNGRSLTHRMGMDWRSRDVLKGIRRDPHFVAVGGQVIGIG
jgi:hypothetical protein